MALLLTLRADGPLEDVAVRRVQVAVQTVAYDPSYLALRKSFGVMPGWGIAGHPVYHNDFFRETKTASTMQTYIWFSFDFHS
jgi:hypothetical protein